MFQRTSTESWSTFHSSTSGILSSPSHGSHRRCTKEWVDTEHPTTSGSQRFSYSHSVFIIQHAYHSTCGSLRGVGRSALMRRKSPPPQMGSLIWRRFYRVVWIALLQFLVSSGIINQSSTTVMRIADNTDVGWKSAWLQISTTADLKSHHLLALVEIALVNSAHSMIQYFHEVALGIPATCDFGLVVFRLAEENEGLFGHIQWPNIFWWMQLLDDHVSYANMCSIPFI